MAGRPSDYSQEIADLICDRVSGGQSLRSICREDDMPNKSTVFRWLEAHGEFATKYAHARDEMLDLKAEELEDIGDQAVMAENAVQVAGLRLKADNRKWLLSKLAPKKYGDKIAVGGADDLPAIKAVTRIELVALG